MSKSLAVFDFDRTIVDGDSDDTIIKSLKEKNPPPEWDAKYDWTPYMSNVFEHAFTAGYSENDILNSIKSMRATPGMVQLLKLLKQSNFDIIILSDANTVFVSHWLEVHGLMDCIKSIITNKAFWHNSRLYIEPYMEQTQCHKCPGNMCKTIALKEYCRDEKYDRIIYTGDGRNDFCPSKYLDNSAIVFPRKGYPLDDLIRLNRDSVQAKVVPWEDCRQIIEEIFPKTD